MQVKQTKFSDAWVLLPQSYGDDRGWFSETYKKSKMNELGFEFSFIQDNQSFSLYEGTLRGLHYQEEPYAQTKLIQVLEGSIFDVIVDIRPDSDTFGQWESFVLTDNNRKQLLIPKGFAHGFYTLEDNTRVLYKVDRYYSAEHDKGLIWNDSDLNIKWPSGYPRLSKKDSEHPTFREVFK